MDHRDFEVFKQLGLGYFAQTCKTIFHEHPVIPLVHEYLKCVTLNQMLAVLDLVAELLNNFEL